MNYSIEKLKKCNLFKDIEEIELIELMSLINPRTTNYSKNETIAFEGDECTSIGIILEGNIEIQKLFLSGKTMIVNSLGEGDIFGEVIVFSKMKTYPSTIIASSMAKILFISKNDIVNICSLNIVLLNNFMELLSNKILVLNKKIKNLSFDTIREKICSYILDEYQKQKSKNIILPFTRKEMAENLGVQRPSLSREFIKMKEEGLIDFNKNNVTILDMEALEDYLY
jgi:CRP-like cAMP-binding protein